MDFYYYNDGYYVVPSSGKYLYALSYKNGIIAVTANSDGHVFISHGEKINNIPEYLKHIMVFILFDYEIDTFAFIAIQRAVG